MDVPPISNAMMRSKPDSMLTFAAPTIPPAGPDKIASFPLKRLASVNPPLDCMKSRRTPREGGVHAVDVFCQHRREVRVHDGRITPID